MSCLVVRLFGPPQIDCDGASVTVSRRKAIALLAYLAVTGQSHRRDSLVNLLWPELDTSSGRSALRRTLYALNQALEGEWLDVDRHEIGLALDTDTGTGARAPSRGSGQGLWVDVAQFRQHLADCEGHGHPPADVCPACVDPLSQAAALVRGEFLSGFGLPDSANFDDWQLLQTEALRRELAGALDRLVRWHSAEREFDAALAHARRRLALDPFDESAHRALMRLYAWSGRRPAALRQYEECVEVLEDQLGVPPGEATTELYRAIEAGQAPPLPTSGEGRGHPAPSGEAAAAPAFLETAVPVERSVFVARERELAQLEAHLEAALAGQGRVVFVTGDAGSGKTALIQAFARRAQEAHPDLIIAGGHGNAQTGVGDPYLPFREILGLLTGDVEAQWAAGIMTREQARRLWHTLPIAAQALVESGPDLIDTFVLRAPLVKRARSYAASDAAWLQRLAAPTERRPATGPGISGPQQSDLFEQYTHVLQALVPHGPLLLVVDDLQWADLGTISLLFHVGRQLVGCPILIIGAYRPEELALGRAEPWTGSGQRERHPLEPVVNEFQRDFGHIMVSLGRAESRDFVEAYLDCEPNRLGTAFRQMLFRQTRGHPLFTIELLRGLQEQGDLVRDAQGRWVEGPALDWERLPARVEAVIAERISRLAEPLQATMRVASVEGEVFTAEVLARVRAADEREVVGLLSRELDRRHRLIRAQGVLRVDGQRLSQYRFRHILFQRYLYNSLDDVEREYLHEAVGSTLEALHAAQPEATAAIAGQLAWHFQEAGMASRAIRYLYHAGERALRLCAYQEAIGHLTRGLELLLALPAPGTEEQQLAHDEQELALQLSLGMAWIGHGAFGPGTMGAAYSRARELCQKLGKISQLCLALGELSVFHYVRAEHQRARKLAEEALDLAQNAGDPLLVALGHWYLGLALFALGEYKAALAHFESTISFYDPQEHHEPLILLRGSDAGVAALAYQACCLWCLGFPEQAAGRSEEVLALARALEHPYSLADVLCFAGCMLYRMRRDAQVLWDCAEELTALSHRRAIPGWAATAIGYQGEAAAMLGQFQDGIALMCEGIAGQQSIGVQLYLAGTMCTLAQAEVEVGLPEQGLTTLADALTMVGETGERYWEAELYEVRGELLLRQGDAVGAEASLHKAIEVAQRQEAKSWELRATTALARLWHEQGRTAEAHAILAEVYGWFTEGFDTPDLREAAALLDEIRIGVRGPVHHGE